MAIKVTKERLRTSNDCLSLGRGLLMSWYETKQIWSSDGRVVINLHCGLDSQIELNEIMNELVKAKNLAFPSGAEVFRREMEALGGDSYADPKKTR